MKITKSIKWESATGQKIEARIEIEKSVMMKTAYADGWNVELGNKTYEKKMISIYVDGKYICAAYKPVITTDKKYIQAGCYAQIGRVGIKKGRYDIIMSAMEEAEIEATTEEYTELKAIETEKEIKAQKVAEEEAKVYARQIKNGLCPKCGTYCYGDCEA